MSSNLALKEAFNHYEVERVLKARLDSLKRLGDADKSSLGTQQLSGAVSLASAATIAFLGAQAFAFPVGCLGLFMYGQATIREGILTGSLRPIPLSGADIGSIALSADNSTRADADRKRITGYNYLTDLEKAEFALINNFGRVVAQVLQRMNPSDRAAEWVRVVDIFDDLYGEHIKESPRALLGQVSPQDLFKFLTATPEQLHQMASEAVAADAIVDVPAQPVKHSVFQPSALERPSQSNPIASPLAPTELEPIATPVASPSGFGGTAKPIVSQGSSIAAAPSVSNSKYVCPIEVIARDPFQSIACIGGQRTGKTWTAAMHTQKCKAERKCKVIYINLMDALGDAANDWGHADICVTAHLRKMSEFKAKAKIEEVITIVREFFNGSNTILVFDEWVGFCRKSNNWVKKAANETALARSLSKEEWIEPEGIGTTAVELMDLMMAVVGELNESGKKQTKSVWLISPKVKAGSMESQGLIIKDIAPIVVVIAKDKTIEWAHPDTGEIQKIGFDDAGYRASIQNLGLPPIDSIPNIGATRMLYYQGTWYSLDNVSPPQKTASRPEPDTWVGEGRSDAPPDLSEMDALMRMIAAQALASSGLQQRIMIEAVGNAKRFNAAGQTEEALNLLRRQIHP